MINTGLHEDLHNLYADLWNSAVETGGNSRFLYSLSCWLESCAYEDLPKYMKSEYDRGRVIIYPLFPKYSNENMGYKKEKTLSQIKKRDEEQKGLWLSIKRIFAKVRSLTNDR